MLLRLGAKRSSYSFKSSKALLLFLIVDLFIVMLKYNEKMVVLAKVCLKRESAIGRSKLLLR